LNKKVLFSLSLAAATWSVAAVGTGYSLFGGGSYVHPGFNSNTAVQLVSNSTSPFSGIDFGVPANLTFADLQKQTLAAEYYFTQGTCGLGSPRFQINVQTPTMGIKNAFVYIVPPPNYTNCPANVWTNPAI
jgi:hypothetical protein